MFLNRQFLTFQVNFRLEKGKILNIEDHFVIHQYNIAVKILLGFDVFIISCLYPNFMWISCLTH